MYFLAVNYKYLLLIKGSAVSYTLQYWQIMLLFKL